MIEVVARERADALAERIRCALLALAQPTEYSADTQAKIRLAVQILEGAGHEAEE